MSTESICCGRVRIDPVWRLYSARARAHSSQHARSHARAHNSVQLSECDFVFSFLSCATRPSETSHASHLSSVHYCGELFCAQAARTCARCCTCSACATTMTIEFIITPILACTAPRVIAPDRTVTCARQKRKDSFAIMQIPKMCVCVSCKAPFVTLNISLLWMRAHT